MLDRFLKNIELWLSFAGLLVVWAAAAVVSPDGTDVWRIAALAALGVSVLHGAIFWTVRRRQRVVRERAIEEIREMMADRVKNQLAVIGLYLPMAQDREAFAMAVDGINDSITQVTHIVDGLSNESLTSWKGHYREAVANATSLVPA